MDWFPASTLDCIRAAEQTGATDPLASAKTALAQMRAKMAVASISLDPVAWGMYLQAANDGSNWVAPQISRASGPLAKTILLRAAAIYKQLGQWLDSVGSLSKYTFDSQHQLVNQLGGYAHQLADAYQQAIQAGSSR